MFEGSLVRLREGETYTVMAFLGGYDPGYILAEVKSSYPDGSFRADRFIPCSDIDEMELVNEKIES